VNDSEFEPSPAQFASLVRSVAVLALPHTGQVAWLESLTFGASNVGELALDFEDGYLIAPQLVAAGWLTSEFVRQLGIIDALLDEMSGASNAYQWTADALQNSPEWEKVRELARAALFQL